MLTSIVFTCLTEFNITLQTILYKAIVFILFEFAIAKLTTAPALIQITLMNRTILHLAFFTSKYINYLFDFLIIFTFTIKAFNLS